MSIRVIYDYIIAGAGPAGLTCAWILAKNGYKCLVIERENTIGGCHRVRRVNGYFCEHGPRIYATAYLNFLDLLSDMNIDYTELFTPYNFSVGSISTQNANSFSTHEIVSLVRTWLYGTFISKNYHKNTSVLQFAHENKFSHKAVKTLDRLCRLSDGAGVERYTLFEFLELFNQNALYTILQPKLPNDIGLMKQWKQSLDKTKCVDFLFEHSIESVNENTNTSSSVVTDRGSTFHYTQGCILALPPRALSKIYPVYIQFEKHTRYEVYIPVLFHYDRELSLPSQHGSSDSSDWELASIVLTDYMKFQHPNSKTVISCCITNTNAISRFTNKTANQSTKAEMIEEMFRQLKVQYPELPNPTVTILSPGVFYNSLKQKWDTKDDAYIRPIESLQPFIPFDIPNTHKVYTVGTHTGQHFYDFTSMESAVTNGIELCKRILPSRCIGSYLPTIKTPVTIDGIVFVFTCVLVVYLISRTKFFM